MFLKKWKEIKSWKVFKNLRINIVFFLIFFAAALILVRLFDLQITKGGYYKALAQGQQSSILEVAPKRGGVYFSNGDPLAVTNEEPFLRICVKEMEDQDKAAEEIAKIVGKSKEEIVEIIETGEGYYKTVKENLLKEETEKIKELDMPGVETAWQNKRVYPNLNTASQIVGFLNKDGQGQYGIEEYFNDLLTGEEKLEEEKVTPWGFLFSGTNDTSGQETSLYLTIDPNIQFKAEQVLKEGLEKYGAASGEIIVAEPGTGKIIAMAQDPNFDPNKYGESEMEYFSNKCVQVPFEPGSIFKPITIAIALEEGKISPDTTFVDNLGYRLVSGYKVYNYSQKAWGTRTMSESLQYSINVGVMDAETLIGNQTFYEYIKNFGFMERTGVELAGEFTSQNSQLKTSLDNGIQVNFANASFGQGIEMTPLQIIRAFCGIANDGRMPESMTVIEKEIVDGKEKTMPEKNYKTVVSKETTDKLAKMMVNVVENGYGHLAKIPGYYIAGKTGTAQVPYSVLGENRSGYSDHTWQTFMGFAPAYDPRFVILVKLDNPQKTKTSEYSSVPMFHDLAKYILDYWQIPPDYDVDAAQAASAGK